MYFTCYTSTLHRNVSGTLSVAGYTDDHAIYGSFKAGHLPSQNSTMSDLQSSLQDVERWMQQHRLKMNSDKSEFVIFGSNRLLPQCSINEISVANATVTRTYHVKLRGVLLDENLTFKQHISMKSRVAAVAMYNIKKLKKYLDRPTCLKLANALVFSHMDYCNSLFINLPSTTLAPFQRIQNLTAKIILDGSEGRVLI